MNRKVPGLLAVGYSLASYCNSRVAEKLRFARTVGALLVDHIHQVKHPEQSMLKRLKSHPLELTRKLTSSLMVPVHGSMIDLSTSTKAPSALCLDR